MSVTEIPAELPELATSAEPDLSSPFEWIFVAAACLVVLAGLAPDLVLTDSFPLGTDLTGHVIVPWFDSQNPWSFLPGSWSNDAFNGFPINQLYPWLPSYAMGLLSLVLPLAVSVKLLTVLPLALLPLAAWRSARWANLSAVTSVMIAAAMVPFIYDTSCGSCGGNVTSTISGEYAFAWAMVFSVLALGAADRLARSGRGPVLTAVLVVATAFSHPLASIWLVIGISTVAIAREVWTSRERALHFGTSAAIAVLVSLLWWLPFLMNRDWMPENPLLRDPGFLEFLFPASTPWEIGLAVLAVIGVARSARTRDPLLLAFFVGAVVALAAFWRFTDGGPFFSMRVLPFWFIAKWVFAALGFAWLVTVGAARVRQRTAGDSDPRLAPVAWLALATVVIGFTWGWFGTTKAPTTSEPGSANILGFEVPVTSSAALRPVLAGFAARPDYPQLQSVQNLLREVAQKNGCGTLMWDAGDPAQEGGPIFGDAQVFWQSAIWTEGCIPAADGVLVDSSMTAPAMGMTKSMVSTTVERLLPGRPQFELDIAGEGAKRMQAMGIRYYLTHGGQPATDAATSKLLTLIARAGTWEIWEVNKGVPVASLANLPAVFEPTLSDSDWESLSTRYFTTPSFTTVPITQSGSSSWPKASLTALPQQTGTEPAGVFDIRLNDGRVTFSVQKVGKPVVVRLSAFPGWSVVGAEGPYRATANYMVVVPTSTTVTLTKGRTTIDWIAIISALLGLGLAVGVVVFRVLQSRGGAPEGHELEDADVDSDTLAGVLAASEDTSAEQV